MEFQETLIKLIALALAVSSITFIISMSSIFEGFRERVSSIHDKLDELVHCPLCLSPWFFIYVLSMPGMDIIEFFSWYSDSYFILGMNYLFNLFFLVAISSLGHHVMIRAYDPVAALKAKRAIMKRKAQEKKKENG